MATAIFSFPFEQIGVFLRDMSLSGTLGNIAAIIIYVGISLIPVLIWLILRKKKEAKKADLLLFFLSAVVFYVLYYSINPGLFETSIPGTRGLYLSGMFYSVLVTYGVARIQSMAMENGGQTIYQLLRIFLGILVVLFVGIALLELLVTMPDALQKAKEAYDTSVMLAAWAGAEQNLSLGLMEAMVYMESLMNVAPYVLDLIIIWKAWNLITELQKDWYSEASVKASEMLAKASGITLVTVAGLGMLNNMLQIVGRNYVTNTNLKVSIPIISIIFVLAILLAARYISASQELKTENDLFV